MRLALAVLLVGALALPTRAAAGDPLARASSASRSAAYAGDQIIVTADGGAVHVTLARVEHDPPDWTRIEYRPFGTGARWVVIRQGDAEIQYDPLARTGIRTDRIPVDDDALLAGHLAWLRENYRVTSAPGQLLGRSTDRVVIAPRTPDRPTHRFDIDRDTGIVLRAERRSPSGATSELAAFLSLELKPRGWRRGAAAPAGLTLRAEASRAPFSAQDPVPISAPTGFHRVGAYRLADGALEIVYSDGLSTLVVYERPGAIAQPPGGSRLARRQGGAVWVGSAGLRTLAHWERHGWLVTLVGDLTPDTLLAAADRTGVDPAPRIIDRLLAWLRGLVASL